MKTARRAAFSLVEVVLALGIVSFTLVAILGLLGTALDTNSASARDTALAAMSAHVLNELRALPFDALWEASPREAASKNLKRQDQPTTEPTVYYFSAAGAPLEGSGPEAIYLCTVTKEPDLVTRTADNGPFNQLKLTLDFTWPMIAPESGRENRTIHAAIARY